MSDVVGVEVVSDVVGVEVVSGNGGSVLSLERVLAVDWVLAVLCVQSFSAWLATRLRPSLTVARSLGSTLVGSFFAASWAADAAVRARPHLPLAAASVTDSSLLLMASAFEEGMRLLRSPQATSNAAESPSAAASRSGITRRIAGCYWPYSRRSASESGSLAARIAAAAAAMSYSSRQ